MAKSRKRPRVRLRKPVAKPTRVHVPKTAYSRRRAKARARAEAAEGKEPKEKENAEAREVKDKGE